VCASLGGIFTASTITGTETVTDCLNDNGACCTEFDDGKRSLRTTILIVLSTPYCIGFLIAMFLNLTMPQDKDDVADPPVPTGKTAETEDKEEKSALPTTTATAMA